MNISRNYIVEIIGILVKVELDLQMVLHAHFHVDLFASLGHLLLPNNPNLLLLDQIRTVGAGGHNAQTITNTDIDAVVGFELLRDLLEGKLERLGISGTIQRECGGTYLPSHQSAGLLELLLLM